MDENRGVSIVDFVRRRPITFVVAAMVVVVLVGSLIAGPTFAINPLPVSQGVAGWWFTTNWCLSVITFVCVWRNLKGYEGNWTWQELAFLRGVLLLVFGSTLGYLSRAFNDPTISIGTPVITAGLLLMIYGSLRPPERFVEGERHGPGPQ